MQRKDLLQGGTKQIYSKGIKMTKEKLSFWVNEEDQ